MQKLFTTTDRKAVNQEKINPFKMSLNEQVKIVMCSGYYSLNLCKNKKRIFPIRKILH